MLRRLKGKIKRYVLYCPVCGQSSRGFEYEDESVYVVCSEHGCFKMRKLKQIPMELRV